MLKLTAYTDGSSTVYRNKEGDRFGGIGIYFENYPEYSVSESMTGKLVSNQRAELTASLVAIKTSLVIAKGKPFELTIIADSMYMIKCVTEWAIKWEKDDWTRKGEPIAHLDIVKPLYDYVNKYNVKFIHINSHKKEPSNKNTEEWKRWYGNDMADKLANEGMEKALSKKK